MPCTAAASADARCASICCSPARWISLSLMTLLALAVLLAPAGAQDENEPLEPGTPVDDEASDYEGRELAEDRWLDREYGLSMRLPIGVRTVSRTADDHQLRVADEDGEFTMSVVVKQSRRKLELVDVLAEAKVQVLGVHNSSELLDEYALRVSDDLQMGVLMFRMPHDREDDAFLAQAFVQMDPQTFAIVEASSEWSEADEVRPTFEAMLQTLELQGLKELEEKRKREIERTQNWRRDLKVEQLHAALIEEQTFRIVSEDKDIGYMRMRQEQAEQQDKPGIQVEIRSRVVTGDYNVDTRAVYFSSDDDKVEFWEVTSTQRARRGDREEQTFVETGIRTGADIVITQDRSLGSKQTELKQPASGYVPLAETWILPQILPNDRPATYGFYSYNTNERSLTYRTEKVEPALNGYEVVTHLRPNAPPLQASFNADRSMREKQLSPQQKLVPATQQEIARRWGR